ncbi:hypothetical protein Fmac_017583 [Flemingia macrophylla]|uniref:Uncharacterized protein n=1 Tax=Flemingia macrophylla TaxID=520843 RepID=A0ABD1M305_9FABA
MHDLVSTLGCCLAEIRGDMALHQGFLTCLVYKAPRLERQTNESVSLFEFRQVLHLKVIKVCHGVTSMVKVSPHAPLMLDHTLLTMVVTGGKGLKRAKKRVTTDFYNFPSLSSSTIPFTPTFAPSSPSARCSRRPPHPSSTC